MGWLFLGPALFGIWRYRYWAYWKSVLPIAPILWGAIFLFSANGTLENPWEDGIVTQLIRRQSNDGPMVLWVALGFAAAVAVSVIFIRQAHRATLPPHSGKAAKTSAGNGRKVLETLGLLAGVLLMNLTVGTLIALATPAPQSGPGPITLEDEVAAAARQVTATAPTKLDETTTLERATAEGRTLVYHYTITVDAPDEAFDDWFWRGPAHHACQDAGMRADMARGVIFAYSYAMPSGDVIRRDVSQAICETRQG